MRHLGRSAAAALLLVATSGLVAVTGALPAAAASLPGAPTGVVGTPGDGQIRLTWTAPSSNGGAAITDYWVQGHDSQGGGAALVGSATTSLTITGLVNGTAYWFEVAAVNSVGTGPWSATSAIVTPRTVPDAPGTPVARARSHQVTLSWSRPSSNGGAWITDYVIQFRQVGTSLWRRFGDGVSTVRSATVTGLVNGRRYAFRVAARNAAGTGPYSAVTTATPHA